MAVFPPVPRVNTGEAEDTALLVPPEDGGNIALAAATATAPAVAGFAGASGTAAVGAGAATTAKESVPLVPYAVHGGKGVGTMTCGASVPPLLGFERVDTGQGGACVAPVLLTPASMNTDVAGYRVTD